MASGLRRLQPLARRLFEPGHEHKAVFRTVPTELMKELEDTWLLRAEPWVKDEFDQRNILVQTDSSGKEDIFVPICCKRAGGICLEEHYLILYLEFAPAPPLFKTDDAHLLARLATMMTNRLSYRGRLTGEERKAAKLNSSALRREFKSELDKNSARRRFQGNESLPLIQGITGETITAEDMFVTLAGPGWKSMLGDRFLLNSLFIKPGEENAEYSGTERTELVRRARGMNASYLPPSLDALAGHVVPIQTFANVLFMAASEGVAAHVKPVPKGEFLKNEFPIRYRTSYFLLFSLAAYQHYRLIDLIGELANCMSNLDDDIGNESRIDKLRRIRKKLVLHELKYINTQPAFLTNYQQYYAGLRQALNTEALVQKLRRSVRELDCLLADEEYRAKNLHEEQVHKGKVLLAMLAESVALPYYLYNILAHALHLGEGFFAAAVTILITLAALRNTWLIMHGKSHWRMKDFLYAASGSKKKS